MRRFHFVATLVWALLAIPTLIWWRDSVPWIALMSVYAVVVSHWSAWQAAKAEQAAGDVSSEAS
jgi:hypothetical protein